MAPTASRLLWGFLRAVLAGLPVPPLPVAPRSPWRALWGHASRSQGCRWSGSLVPVPVPLRSALVEVSVSGWSLVEVEAGRGAVPIHGHAPPVPAVLSPVVVMT